MNPSVPILMYHAIAAPNCSKEAGYTTTPEAFEAQLRLLAQAGYQSLTVSELANRWETGGRLPAKPVVLTFDDGFACLHETALPIMERYGFRATIYLISGYLDRMGRFDADKQIRGRPMLARSQVIELQAAGMEIGSHTVNHPDLRRLSPAALRNELQRSRADLQDLTGTRVDSFCYPRGVFDRMVYEAVIDAGYRSACSTLPGLSHRGSDHWLLRRAQIGSQTDNTRFLGLLRQGASVTGVMRSMLREQVIRAATTLRGLDPMDFYRLPIRHAFGSPNGVPG